MSDTQAPSRPVVTGRRLFILSAVLLGLTVAVGVACSFIGRLEFSWAVWWQFRVFRLLVAAIVGAGLSVAGMALQGLLRNPLADPYILGISSGAGVGYLVGLTAAPLLHWPELAATPVATLLGAAATCLLVYGLSQRRGRLDPYVLLLSGVIVNVMNGAVILAIMMFLLPNRIIEFIGWGMGRVPEWLWMQPALLATCAVGVAGGWVAIFLRGSAMNALGLGDEVASSSGVGVHGLRIETFGVVSLMTAASVALAGPIGFLGLIVPHVCRLIGGPDHRQLAILSGFVGAMFLMATDTFCRMAGVWIGRGEIPLGVVTAFCGGPFFIFLLRRHGREGRL